MRPAAVSTTAQVSADPAYVAYSNGDYKKSLALLSNMKGQVDNPFEIRRLVTNMKLCECRMNGVLFSTQYRDSLLEIFPELKSPKGRLLSSRAEAFVAYNLALNAFARGNRRTAIDLLHCILTLRDLPNKLFFVVSLLEIEMSLMLCQPKLALKLALRLRDNVTWRRASASQKDYLDCLEQRIRCRLAQTASPSDCMQKTGKLHWCLLQSELDVKTGNALRGFNRLRRFRSSVPDEERRLVDNAIGCVYALSFKKPGAAETYFKSAMLSKNQLENSKQESIIPRHCLIYHAALAQLHSNQPESAFNLFLSILPYYPRQPRIWLRLAECCIFALTKSGLSDKVDGAEHSNDVVSQVLGKGSHMQLAFTPGHSWKPCLEEKDPLAFSSISWEFASHCVRNALVFTSTERDCGYLLPWLYTASAFININLGRPGLALRATRHLFSLPQVSPHHKYMAVLYKTEALLLLDRIEEAQKCLDEAIPLQSIPLTASALMYNRALLQSFTENFAKSHAIYSLMNVGRDIPFSNQVILLGIFVNLKLGKIAEAKRLVEEQIGKKIFTE